MTENSRSIRLAGSDLGRYTHVCAFFHSRDEWYKTLLPFITDGLQNHEKAFHIVDPSGQDEHMRRLRAGNIDVAEVQSTGQLEIRNWYEAYLREGHFDQDSMLSLIQEVLNGGTAQGFVQTRLIADMEWALEDRPGVEDIVEYETRLNYILPRYRDPVV